MGYVKGMVVKMKREKITKTVTTIAAAYGVVQMIATLMMREGKRLERNNKGKKDKRYLSFMNGSSQKLKDEQVKSIDVTSIMGGMELDLTGAELAPETKIHARCLMSGLVIKVPPMVEVRDDARSIMSGVANMVPQYHKEGLPVIRVNVECVMSGVSIKVVCEEK